MVDLSIIITVGRLTKDSYYYWSLDWCLFWVSKQTILKELVVEVIVSDYGSADISIFDCFIKKYSNLDIKVVHTSQEETLGLWNNAKCFNVGVKSSLGRTIILLHPDNFVNPRGMKVAYEKIKDGGVIVFGNKLLIREKKYLDRKKVDIKRIFRDVNTKQIGKRECPGAIGDFMVLLKEDYDKIGWYDEDFCGYGYDDVEFGCRVYKKYKGKMVRIGILDGFYMYHPKHGREFFNKIKNQTLYDKKIKKMFPCFADLVFYKKKVWAPKEFIRFWQEGLNSLQCLGIQE